MSEPQYVDSFVAFLDILGFKKIAMNEKFSFLYDLFHDITNFSNLLLKSNNNVMTKDMLDTVTVNIISDSIFISVPKSTDRSLEILVLLINTLVFNLFIEYGVLVRGGIAEGDYYADDRIAFGPGLVKAYSLENSLAVYPRIIFTRNTNESYMKIVSPEKYRDINELISLDCDDQLVFCDYIGFAFLRISHDVIYQIITPQKAQAIFARFKNILEDDISKEIDMNVRKKLLWFRNYYNNVLENIVSHNDLPFKYDFIFGENIILS